MKFTFSEKAWTPQDVLNFWQDMHGQLEPSWQEKFLNDSNVKKMCTHHPEHIRSAVANWKKIEFALNRIIARELKNENSTDELLDELHPDHALGITNAHLGNRTTDPFDPQREELLFKCENCNLKLSNALKSKDSHPKKMCIDCAERDT
jgi:hypothetical protein